MSTPRWEGLNTVLILRDSPGQTSFVDAVGVVDAVGEVGAFGEGVGVAAFAGSRFAFALLVVDEPAGEARGANPARRRRRYSRPAPCSSQPVAKLHRDSSEWIEERGIG